MPQQELQINSDVNNVLIILH